MNTVFKNRIFAVASLFAMLFIAPSCEDNIGIQVTPEAPNADKTLYEVITNDNDLTDFVEVLNACNIPSEKDADKIISVADSLFNTSRVYTVWAPMNGSFDKDSVLERIQAGYRDEVFKTFVCSHVANFLKPAKGRFDEEGELVLMLNEKKLLFAGSYKEDEGGYTFGGVKLYSVNDRVKNGIIHKLESVSEYEYNIWEYIRLYADNSSVLKVDSFVNYLYSYNDTVYPDYLRTPGPIVAGVQTYLDSVPKIENEMLARSGMLINNEDSLYTFYIPTNEAWEHMIARAEKHFNYAITQNTDTAFIDSIRLYHTRYNLIKYLAYSQKEQRYVKAPDSIMPIGYGNRRKMFAFADVENSVVETKELSNGTLKIVNEYPYSIFDLWHDTIKVEAEDTYYIDDEKTTMSLLKTYTVYDKEINKEAGEKLSGTRYIVFGDEDDNKTSMEYRIPDIKSATYKVFLVTVPRNIRDSKLDLSKDEKPRINCYVSGTDPKDGKVKTLFSKKNLYPAIEKIDTIEVGEVTFRACEYQFTSKVKEYTTKVKVTGETVKSNKTYSNTIRLDAIILVPIEDKDAE